MSQNLDRKFYAVAKKALENTKHLNDRADILTEDSMQSVFLLHNDNYFHSGQTIEQYRLYFGSVRELDLIGFDDTKQHRLRLIARSHSSFNYRFIICARSGNSGVWSDVFDAGSGFTVTENPNGLTDVELTIGTKTVRMKVDYNNFPNGASINDGLLGADDGRYRINPKCFARNQVSTLNKSLFASKNGTSYKVKYRFNDTENMMIEFNKLGVNEIIHPKRIYKETSSQLTANMELAAWYTLGTDWISPYSNIEAANGTTTFIGTTGGNHGTDGAGGFPTARNVSSSMYADGAKVVDGENVNCDEVTLVVVNYISAANHIDPVTGSKADSLEEVVTYKITPGNIEISVYLTAMEELTINGYAGLQMTTDMISGEYYFNDSSNKFFPDGTARSSEALPFDVDRMIYADDQHVFATYTNRSVGLGDLSYRGSASVYTASVFNKLYAHLLNSPITLLNGASTVYSGGYSITHPLPCDGAEKAYFVKYNGTKEYCVDFLSPVTNTYFEIGKEHVGKQIEIVDQSSSITCDNIVSGKGLKISANDFGTLKFKVKS